MASMLMRAHEVGELGESVPKNSGVITIPKMKLSSHGRRSSARSNVMERGL